MNISPLQIEGFKLHVAHNIRPFVNKIRYAPEVASRPDRLAKDLQNAKLLATILEDQAVELRAFKPPVTLPSVPAASSDQDGTGGAGEESAASSNGNTKAEDQDTEMAAPDHEGGGVNVEEEELKERGSDAVERRIEKVMSDLVDQGLVDVNDEGAFKEKKVGSVKWFLPDVTYCSILFAFRFSKKPGCSISRHVPCVFASRVPHMLLLRYRYRSS